MPIALYYSFIKYVLHFTTSRFSYLFFNKGFHLLKYRNYAFLFVVAFLATGKMPGKQAFSVEYISLFIFNNRHVHLSSAFCMHDYSLDQVIIQKVSSSLMLKFPSDKKLKSLFLEIDQSH